MRSAHEATSIYRPPAIFGLRARLRTWKSDLFRGSHELREEMGRARRAAGTTGWWSDIPDGWPQEEFQEGRRQI